MWREAQAELFRGQTTQAGVSVGSIRSMRTNDNSQSVNISPDKVKDATANLISDLRTHQNLIKLW